MAAGAAAHDAGAGRTFEVVYAAHRKIFEAVASRDPDRAEAAMREHLEYVAQRYDEVVGGAAYERLRHHRRLPAEAGDADAFRTLIDENALASATNEPGCRRFDVLEPAEEADRVMLYEIYADRAAFDAACRSRSISLRFDTESAAMLASKSVVRCELVCEGSG